MRERVLSMSGNDTLIEKSSRAFRDSENEYLKILPEDLLELPESYTSALDKYHTDKEAYDAELSRLQGLMNTLEMKVMLADDKALSGLIAEAGTLVDLSLVNNQLLLR